jgi:hypothetical protein
MLNWTEEGFWWTVEPAGELSARCCQRAKRLAFAYLFDA